MLAVYWASLCYNVIDSSLHSVSAMADCQNASARWVEKERVKDRQHSVNTKLTDTHEVKELNIENIEELMFCMAKLK